MSTMAINENNSYGVSTSIINALGANYAHKKAVVSIDMTNDFIKTNYIHKGTKYQGTLVAPLGVTIIDEAGKLIDGAIEKNISVLYVEDAHDKNSKELNDWPAHNMRGTPGAETVDELKRTGENVYKIAKDAHSGFENPALDILLKEKGISEVYVMGLVQEICVLQTVNGFLDHGYKVNLVIDATVPFKPYDGFRAMQDMENRGVRMINLEDALDEL